LSVFSTMTPDMAPLLPLSLNRTLLEWVKKAAVIWRSNAAELDGGGVGQGLALSWRVGSG
jgi:hypothetical protein